MKLHRLMRLLVVAMLVATVANAAPDEWEDAAAYEQGASRESLSTIEAQVTAALARRATRRAVVGALGRLVADEAATFDGRLFACRQLARIGGEESVDHLAPLLRDERLCDGARYALERIEAEVATDALRDALGEVDGLRRIGVINSLGERRDARAVPLVASLLPELDRATTRTAVEMLGEVGDERAARLLLGLERARQPGTGPALNLLADALLRCGDHLAAEGSADLAVEVFAAVASESHHQHVRVAGLRGLVFLIPVETAVTVVELLGSDDPVWRGAASRLIETVPGTEATEAYAELLPLLEGEDQVRLLEVLARRGDPAATPAILPLLLVRDWSVARASITALGRTGDASAVLPLALLAANGNEQARTSLYEMKAPDVDMAIGRALHAEEVPGVRTELAKALGRRRAMKAAPVLVSVVANDPVLAVRSAAFDALGMVAGLDQLQTMILLLTRATHPYEIASGVDALAATCLRLEDVEARAEPIVAALDWARGPARVALLRVIGRIGGESALFAVAGTLREEGEVAEVACEVLAEWPDADLAEALLAIARNTDGAPRRAAFEGLVHTAAKSSGRPAEATVELFREAFRLAEDDEMKLLALDGLAGVVHADALYLAGEYLESAVTRERAALTMIAVAGSIGEKGYEAARAAVDRAREACPTSPAVRQRAGEVIDELERDADYITSWLFAGPFQREGTDGSAIFDVAFPPEPGGPVGEVEWRELPAEAITGPGRVDLTKLASASHCCGYLACELTSGKVQQALLKLGSDDGLEVWLNGESVHAMNAMRGLTPGSDRVLVELKQGTNTLLLKVTQGGGDWAATCRIRSAEGYHLDDVKVAAPE